MAGSVFPIPVITTGKNINVTVPNANTLYSGTTSLIAGLYRVTCVSGTITNLAFWNGSTLIGTATTSSGTVDFNLGTQATKITVYTNTGSNIIVTATFLAEAIVINASGTLDTLTTTQTYTQTGPAYVVVVGGGGGGGSSNGGGAAGGGGSGGVNSGYISLTGSTSVTIGAFGVGAAGGTNGTGTTGGTTTIGSISATGGTGGSYGGDPSNNTGGGAGGTPGGGAGGGAQSSGNPGQNGTASSAPTFLFVKTGTTGGGGGGGATTVATGAGSGIGTGGNGGLGAYVAFSGTAGTGYGSGGGGAGRFYGGAGFNGAPGVVYVLRGF